MQINAKHITIDVPDGMFSGHSAVHQRIMAWNMGERPGFASPMVSAMISEIADLDEDVPPGPPVVDRLRAWMAKAFEDVDDLTEEQVTVAGRPGLAWIVEWTKPAGAGGAPPSPQFELVAKVPIDERLMMEFMAWGDAGDRETLEPVFRKMLASVALHGDPHPAMDEQLVREQQLMARLDALEDKAEGLVAAVQPIDRSQDLADVPGPVPPADGEVRVRIGTYDFELSEARWCIGKVSARLVVNLELRAEEPGRAREAKLLRDHHGEGTVSLELSLAGAAEAGPVPRADLLVRDDRVEPQGSRLRIDGLDYSLRFSGRIVLEGGWVLLTGAFDVSYESGRREPVEIAVRLDPADLDWSSYTFATLGEVRAADPAVVRKVSIRDYPLDVVDPAILSCPNLERFHVYRHGWDEGPPLILPPELFRLPRLQRVFTHRYAVTELPEEAAHADGLVDIGITEAALERVPEALFAKRNLEKLDLRGNRLTTLPASIDLPALASLDVSGNQLTELPEALLDQPLLKRLHLSNNPWDKLPGAALPLVQDLSLAELGQYFDYAYPGADGTGTVEWDETLYRAESRPSLVEALGPAFGEEDLGQHEGAVRSMLRLAVGFIDPALETYDSRGNHRFGGFPDLPRGMAYPRFSAGAEGAPTEGYAYEFIAQLDLADLAPHQGYLPRTGTLYFFLKTIHEVYGGGPSAARVIHWDGDPGELTSGKGTVLTRDDYYEMMEPCYAPQRYSARAFASVPHLYGHRSNPHLFRGRAEALGKDESFLRDASLDVLHDAEKAACPRDHDIGAFGFTQNEDAESQAALARRGDPADWLILLRVGSRGDFCWGDAGDLFFLIHKSDLAKGDFSAVHCAMESS